MPYQRLWLYYGAPFQSPFTTRMGIRRTHSRLKPPGPHVLSTFLLLPSEVGNQCILLSVILWIFGFFFRYFNNSGWMSCLISVESVSSSFEKEASEKFEMKICLHRESNQRPIASNLALYTILPCEQLASFQLLHYIGI